MTNTKIFAKIKKCLALSTSAQPHEAAAALARAQEMMAKYGISTEALDATDTANLDATIIQTKVSSIASVKRTKAWEVKLFRAVCDAFGCELLFAAGYSKNRFDATTGEWKSAGCTLATYEIIGFDGEVQVATYAATVLLRQLRKAKAVYTKGLPKYYQRKEKTIMVDSYCMGWVESAATKLPSLASAKCAAATEQDRQNGTTTALVVQSNEDRRLAELRNHINEKSSGKAARQNARGISESARKHGLRDGHLATINKSVGSKTSTDSMINQHI